MRGTARAASAAAVAGIGLLAGACGSSSPSAAGPGAGAAATTATAGASTGTSAGATSAQPSDSAGSPAPPAGGASSSAVGYPVDLQPPTAAPGSQVMVYGLSCVATTGTATSTAFSARVALSVISNATGGAATVKPGLAPGRYPVTVTCGNITATGTLTVS